MYKTRMMLSHDGLNISSGFFISTGHPFLGASPDALTECKCCGSGVIEVKCPLCAQRSSFEEAADQGRNFALKSCLRTGSSSNATMATTTNASYKFMHVTRRGFCDFVVWTNAEVHSL